MKAAIYARYSTDLQSERSIDDQVALCRAYCLRNSLTVVGEFADRARSGASVHGRDGLALMMDEAGKGAFDVVVVEALDRVSRDQEDLPRIFKRLRFLGIELRAVHEGRADAIQVGVRGLVGALYLEDLAQKIHRGQAGVVRDGRHAGGRAYGYRLVPGQPGVTEIDETQAAVVRRIFDDYLAGQTPRAIASALNNEGVPPPRGAVWNSSTLNGSRKRRTGILQNEIYIGRIIWNKTRKIKDPDTGKRVPRLNAGDQYHTAEAPHLAIIPEETFQAVQQLKAARGSARPEYYRQPKRLLSGLLKCGKCGGGMTTAGKGRGGVPRIHCTRAIEAGTCDHRRKYNLLSIEEETLRGLRQELRDPQLIGEFVRAYHAERRHLAANSANDKARIDRELSKTKGRIARLVNALADGLVEADAVKDKLAALEVERRRLEAEVVMAAASIDPVAIHPAAVNRYLRVVGQLASSLRSGSGGPIGKDGDHLRTLIERVIVHPVPTRAPLDIEIRGYLAQLLDAPQIPPNGRYRSGGNDGAAGGN
jgi:DNA invertase Pin-like site-specific DNA recombinase